MSSRLRPAPQLLLLPLLFAAALLACSCAQASESYVLITGGTVVNHDHSERLDVLIGGGKILEVGPPGTVAAPDDADDADDAESAKAKKTRPKVKRIDAYGKLVMPGGIDPHTHLAMPFMGHVACDDFTSGHRAALAGGTTWHIDFALPAPPATASERAAAARSRDGGVGEAMRRGYREWRAKAAGRAVMDYSFHMAVTAWSDDVAAAMGELAAPDKGVNSFKFFMAYKDALMVTDEQLLNGFARCRDLQALPMVHAENGDAVAAGQASVFERAGISAPHGHALSRPKSLEAEATGRALRLAAYAGAPLYVVHVMAGEAADEVGRARGRGERAVGEAVAAGLALDESRMWDANWTVAAAHVMSPPLRSQEDRARVKRALASGELSVIATDHAAFNSSQKRSGLTDFRRIPNGVTAIEERLHVAWTELVARSGLVTPEQFVGLVSSNAAKIFGAYPRKGRVAPGSDADVIVFDPRATHVLSRRGHHSAVDVSVWEGYEAVGRVDVTVSRGRVALEGGRLRVPPFAAGGGEAEEEDAEGADYDPSLAPGTGEFVPLPTGGAMYEGMGRRGLLSGGDDGRGLAAAAKNERGGGGEAGSPQQRHPAWEAEFPYGPGAVSDCGGGVKAAGVCAAA